MYLALWWTAKSYSCLEWVSSLSAKSASAMIKNWLVNVLGNVGYCHSGLDDTNHQPICHKCMENPLTPFFEYQMRYSERGCVLSCYVTSGSVGCDFVRRSGHGHIFRSAPEPMVLSTISNLLLKNNSNMFTVYEKNLTIIQETHWRKRQRMATNPNCSLRRNL